MKLQSRSSLVSSFCGQIVFTISFHVVAFSWVPFMSFAERYLRVWACHTSYACSPYVRCCCASGCCSLSHIKPPWRLLNVVCAFPPSVPLRVEFLDRGGWTSSDFIRTRDTTCQSGCVSLPPSRSVCALASWSCQQQVDFTLCLVVIHGCVVARLMIFSSLCWFEHSLLWSADSYSSHFFYEVDFFLLVWRIF